MQEETRINIDKELLNKIMEDRQSAKNNLKQFFEENITHIQDLLFNYHYDKRERVYDLSIKNDSIEFDGIKGSFRLLYMIGFFNACADLDYNAPEKMKIRFSVDKQNLQI